MRSCCCISGVMGVSIRGVGLIEAARVLSQHKHLDHNVTGECPYDAGGYFIINGSEKTCLGQEKPADNKIFKYKQKPGHKWLWTAEMRSVPDWKCISPKQIYMMVSSKLTSSGYEIVVQLPRLKRPIPLFILFRNLGWIDTFLPLVVPAFFGNAFFIFMYRQFIAQIPEALLEAARLDGQGWFGIWWHVILPLTRPVTAITAVFTFIFTWNDFLAPLIYLQSDDQATLSVALNSFRNQYGGITKVNLLMAASLTTMVPCILLFLAAQKQFIEGLGKGAVKG
ncbi:MAG: ABC transporter permease subunit [Planctomycetes bacterium]|nr:ABC transporter permease subunit [Planctomycetota bacterium]